MTRSSLGELEEVVLLTLLHLNNSAYAGEIVSEIAGRAGRDVASATAYMVLRRLESKGLVKSDLGEPVPERGGRPRRVFTIQPSALPLLRNARDSRLALWKGLEDTMASNR